MRWNREPRNPCCPRCRYDQRGVVATWVDSCPLEGTCPECGLEFNWPEVLHPEKFEPQWCVEFTPQGRSFLLACVKTFLRSFWPWGFWLPLGMAHPIRRGRLLAYCALLLVPLLLLYVAMQTAWALRGYAREEAQLANQWAALPGNIATQQAEMSKLLTDSAYRTDMSPDERQRWITGMQMMLTKYQSNATTPPSISISRVQAVWEAVAFPNAYRSAGTMQSPFNGKMPYPGPRYILAGYHSNLGYQSADWFRAFLFECAAWVGAGTLLTLLLPASVFLLPVTRRRARIHGGHIARVTAYSAFIPVSVILLSGGLAYAGSCPGALGDEAQWMLSKVCRWPIPIMVLVWWMAAMSQYMKCPRAPFVTIVLFMLCSLLLVAATWLIAPIALIESLF